MTNPIHRQPLVSFVLATHNRRSVLENTLARLRACAAEFGDHEIIVVDNASTDGSSAVIADAGTIAVPLSRNAGSCAKAYGVDRATGRYVVFLDDDSFPHPGSIARMIQHFEDDPRLSAAGFRVHLPDGREEGGALPNVFLGCGVGFRSEALRGCGGLDRRLFMQAEEYDLAFRLVGAGRRIRMFDDLHVDHLKTPQARRSQRTTYYDIRNNLRILARYLPRSHYAAYRADCLQRYAWLARRDGHETASRRGAAVGRLLGVVERLAYRRRRLDTSALEQFYRWSYVESRMAELAADGVTCIVFADLGKNIFAFARAAKETGIEVVAIGDDRFARPGRRYRGVPIVPLEDALSVEVDAVVVANSSTVHGTVTFQNIANSIDTPVHHWFGPGPDPVLMKSRSVETHVLADLTVGERVAAASM